MEFITFRNIFETIDEISLTKWNFQQFEEGRIVDLGSNQIEFTVQDGDVVASAAGDERAEAFFKRGVSDSLPLGVPMRYSWDLNIPTDFEYTDIGGNFVVMGQWHHIGTGSPKISIQYIEEGGTPNLYLKIRDAAGEASPTNTYGPIAVTKGTDLGLKFEMIHTTSADGYLKVYVDDVLVLNLTDIATMYPADEDNVEVDRAKFKIGIYRSGAYDDTMTITIKNMEIGEIEVLDG